MTICVFSRLVLIVNDFHAHEQVFLFRMRVLFFGKMFGLVYRLDVLKGNTFLLFMCKWNAKHENLLNETESGCGREPKTCFNFCLPFYTCGSLVELEPTNEIYTVFCVGLETLGHLHNIYTNRQVFLPIFLCAAAAAAFFCFHFLVFVLFVFQSSFFVSGISKNFFPRQKFTIEQVENVKVFCQCVRCDVRV